jgi:hypothetical protein
VAVVPESVVGHVSLPNVVYRAIKDCSASSWLALIHRRFEKSPAVVRYIAGEERLTRGKFRGQLVPRSFAHLGALLDGVPAQPAVLSSTDFEMIFGCRNYPDQLYDPSPFSIQDLHEHPHGASRLPFPFAPTRVLDARQARYSGTQTSLSLQFPGLCAALCRARQSEFTDEIETFIWNG